MSLRLRGPLRWCQETGESRLLPVVLPVAVLLVLARNGQWHTRSQLAALFWPEMPESKALLNLRVQLHKARQLLASLRIAPLPQVELRRLRWAPPLDPAADDAAALPAEGFDLPGFGAFMAWLDAWRQETLGATGVTDGLGEGTGVARREALARLRAAQAAAVVVGGEPGIGKTRLLLDAHPGATWLRCHEGLQSVSFAPVAELVASHRSWWEDLGAYRLDVARLLPEVAPDEPLPPLDAITARVRLFEGLARSAERHLSLLLVDDLQWADAATIDWLALLARRGKLRWVATARLPDLSAHAHQALEALQRSGGVQVVPLGGLDRKGVGDLLAKRRPDLAADPRARAWVEAIWSYTEGNPLCAIEVMAAIGASDDPDRLARMPLPSRVTRQWLAQRDRLAPPARAVVDAAALAAAPPTVAQLAAMSGQNEVSTVEAVEQAQRQGLLVETHCRHDLIREALRSAIGPARAATLHRRAARHLTRIAAAPELIVHHWREAGEPAEAWPFVMRAAQRLRQRGEHAAAIAALAELRAGASDPALALRAQIMLAHERLLDDLEVCRVELEQALARTAALPPGPARRAIEAHALAGLIDCAVFSGALPRALELGEQLRGLIPGLPADVRIEAHQVLIEATMRQGDFDGARASLQALQRAGAPRPVVLSFEAQVHYFCGDVPAARQVFEELLARHADYCQGLTIENDLAVMCQALGELARAEEMARRSLEHWAGVPHTQALSSLVLGTTLASSGRLDEACAAFERARSLGEQQGSTLFVSEAWTRLARLRWCVGDLAAARNATRQARASAGASREPLRASALALMEVLVGCAPHCVADDRTDPRCAARDRLTAIHERSGHPLVHVRHWRAQVACAVCCGRHADALAAARRLQEAARTGSLPEWQCEALWLLAGLECGGAADAARREAQEIALRHGFDALAVAGYGPAHVVIAPCRF